MTTPNGPVLVGRRPMLHGDVKLMPGDLVPDDLLAALHRPETLFQLGRLVHAPVGWTREAYDARKVQEAEEFAATAPPAPEAPVSKLPPAIAAMIASPPVPEPVTLEPPVDPAGQTGDDGGEIPPDDQPDE